MSKPKITLFLDVVSPFAYMGFYALEHWPLFKQCDVSYVPIFLGGLMKACNNTPPIAVKNKDKWINVERLRWANLFDIPMDTEMPGGFPPNTIGVQRALCALTLSQPDKLPSALDALYRAFWVKHQRVQEPEVVLSILTTVLGEKDAEAVVQQSSSPEVKKLLIDNTDKAFASGAFGLPWFVATNAEGKEEGFWGFDHVGQLVDYLGFERPKSGGWKTML